MWQFMLRKGWTSFPTPHGWFEVMRGRLKLEEWPRHQQWHSWSKGWWPPVSEASKPDFNEGGSAAQPPGASPDEVKAAARSWIERLQSALDALGKTESAEGAGQPKNVLREPSRGVSGIHQTLAEPHCSLGGATSEGTGGVGRRDGSHGQVSRRDAQVNSNPSNYARSHTASQDPGVGLGGREAESRIAEMEMEREGARKKRSRSLSVPSPDLVGGPNLVLQEWGALHGQQVGQDRGAIMETLISRGSTLAQSSNRFSHWLEGSLIQHVESSAWGARGVRVGEAQNPGPDMWSKHSWTAVRVLRREQSTRVDGETGVRHRERWKY